MIHAKEARELAEESLFSIRDSTMERIEEDIEKAISHGYMQCHEWIREDIVNDIEWALEHLSGYSISYADIPDSHSSEPNCCYMTISW